MDPITPPCQMLETFRKHSKATKIEFKEREGAQI